MIPFIHCIRDGGYTVGIADNSYKRRAVTQLVKSCRFRANAAVIGNVRSSHRRGKHAIAECNTSNPDETS